MSENSEDRSQSQSNESLWPTWLPRVPDWVEWFLGVGLAFPYAVVLFVGISRDYTFTSDNPSLSFSEFIDVLLLQTYRPGTPRLPQRQVGQLVVDYLVNASALLFMMIVLASALYVAFWFVALRVRASLVRHVRDELNKD